jgi:hypothetical protein
MVTAAVEVPADVVERNLRSTEKIMRFLVEHPEVLAALPDQFELVILPDGDPELRAYNLDLLDRYGSEGKPIVFARTEAHTDDSTNPSAPCIFVPIAA